MNAYQLCVEVYNGKGTSGANRQVVGCPSCGQVAALDEFRGRLMCKDCIGDAMFVEGLPDDDCSNCPLNGDCSKCPFSIMAVYKQDAENYQKEREDDMHMDWEPEWGDIPF